MVVSILNSKRKSAIFFPPFLTTMSTLAYATACGGHAITCYDIDTGSIVASSTIGFGSDGHCAVSSDGVYVIATHTSVGADVLDGNTLEVIHHLPISVATSAAFSPDDTLLAVGGTGKVCLHQVGLGFEILAQTTEFGNDYMRMLHFSPDGSMLIGTQPRSCFLIVSVPEFSPILTTQCDEQGSGIQCAMFLSNTIAITGGNDSVINIWSIPSGERVHALKETHGWVTAMTVSADGELFATGSDDDHTVRIWGRDYTLIHAVVCPGRVYSLAFTQDADRLIVGMDGQPYLVLNVSSGDIKSSMGHANGLPYGLAIPLARGCKSI